MTSEVIAPDNDAVIAAMLRLPKAGALWWLEQWQVRERWIDARYRALRGPWAIVRLLGRERAVPPRLPRCVSEQFQIVVLDHSSGAPVVALLELLEAQVRAHEGAFRWAPPVPNEQPEYVMAPQDVEVERLAFESGIKPALRLVFEDWEAPYEAGLWLRRGASLCLIEVEAGSAGAHACLIVAHDRAAAEALADAELRQYSPMQAQLEALRDCGDRLGYPRCCVEAFLRSTVHESGYDVLANARRGNFLRLDAAWVKTAHPHMNTLRNHEHLGLLSFDPCSLDCPAARAIADRIAAVVEAACPGYVDELRGVFAIDEHDSRVSLELDDRGYVRSARPTREDAEALAGAIVGRRVDEHGRIEGLDRACRVFCFGD